MGKFTSACFVVLALAVIAGELMVVPSVLLQPQPCFEVLPWVNPYCHANGYPTEECLDACEQRHPTTYMTAFCHDVISKGCVCQYRC